jgi:hypothetical protein
MLDNPQTKRLSEEYPTKSLVVKVLGALIFPKCLLLWCRRRESNSHGHKAHWILSPARLPISPLRHTSWFIWSLMGVVNNLAHFNVDGFQNVIGADSAFPQ